MSIDHSNIKAKELGLFKQFKAGQTGVFNYFFERYYQGLCIYAAKMTGSEHTAKDLVQDFFLRFWENRKTIEIQISVKSYFIRSVHNRCLDYLSFQNVRTAHLQNRLLAFNDEDLLEYPLLDYELKQQISEAIRRLPDDIRNTFMRSRFEGLSYQQIADCECISVKTVEYRISKALTALREELRDYLYILIL